jgi:hypothetical protein
MFVVSRTTTNRGPLHGDVPLEMRGDALLGAQLNYLDEVGVCAQGQQIDRNSRTMAKGV